MKYQPSHLGLHTDITMLYNGEYAKISSKADETKQSRQVGTVTLAHDKLLYHTRHMLSRGSPSNRGKSVKMNDWGP